MPILQSHLHLELFVRLGDVEDGVEAYAVGNNEPDVASDEHRPAGVLQPLRVPRGVTFDCGIIPAPLRILKGTDCLALTLQLHSSLALG